MGDPTELPKENPYASPQEAAGWPAVDHQQWSAPHRGGLILGLGISALVFSLVGFACCAAFPVLSLGLSIPAWVMGRNDLRAIAAGTMDPSGRGSTMTGMVLGIVSTALGVLAAVVTAGIVVTYIVIFVHTLNTS
jgi:hypothetical protein